MLTSPTETEFSRRVELVKRADRAARAYDPRIFQVQATYADNLRHVLVATSDGVLSFDRQPLARMSVAGSGARQRRRPRSSGHAGGGGRVELELLPEGERRPSTSPAKPRARPSCSSTPSMRPPAK